MRWWIVGLCLVGTLVAPPCEARAQNQVVAGVLIAEGAAGIGGGIALMATRSGPCSQWMGETCVASDDRSVGPQVLMYSGLTAMGLISGITGFILLGADDGDRRARVLSLSAALFGVAAFGVTLMAGSAWDVAAELDDGACRETVDGVCASVHRRSSVNASWALFGLGGVLAAAGVTTGIVLALHAPDASADIALAPHFDSTGFGLDVSGRF